MCFPFAQLFLNRLFFFSAVILITSPCLQAADDEGRFMVRGAGRAKCQQFLEAQKNQGSEFISFAGWLEGYLTHANQSVPSTFDVAPWQGTEILLAAVSGQCRKNPEQNFHSAVFAMAQTLSPGRLSQRSDFVEVRTEKGSMILYAEVLERVQRVLISRGLLKGEPSRQWDAATEAALKTFQQQKGLTASGLPDQLTLGNLL